MELTAKGQDGIFEGNEMYLDCNGWVQVFSKFNQIL